MLRKCAKWRAGDAPVMQHLESNPAHRMTSDAYTTRSERSTPPEIVEFAATATEITVAHHNLAHDRIASMVPMTHNRFDR